MPEVVAHISLNLVRFNPPSRLRANREQLKNVSRSFTLKTRPECGLDCLVCAILASYLEEVRAHKYVSMPEPMAQMMPESGLSSECSGVTLNVA